VIADQGRFEAAFAQLDTLRVKDPGSEVTPIFDEESARAGRTRTKAGG
jgi:hypothetical protein